MRKSFIHIIIVLLLSAFIVCGVIFYDDIGALITDDTPNGDTVHHVVYDYLPTKEIFEDELKQTTNILRATYVGKSVKMGAVFLEFKPVEQIFGDLGEENFWLWIGDETDILDESTDERFLFMKEAYNPNKDSTSAEYGKNTDYLIVAQKYISVYFPREVYRPTANGIFSIDNLRANVGGFIDELRRQDCFEDNPETVMNILWESWDQEYLKHLTDYFMFWLCEKKPESFIEADVYKTFPEYILSFVKANPDWKEYGGAEYIQSDDFEYIKSQSEIVARIKVSKLGDAKSLSPAECIVKRELKGEIQVVETKINFIPGTVEEGKEYIVCLRDDVYPFEITAKNAVQPAPFDWYSWGVVTASILAVCAVGCLVYIVKRKRKRPAEYTNNFKF